MYASDARHTTGHGFYIHLPWRGSRNETRADKSSFKELSPPAEQCADQVCLPSTYEVKAAMQSLIPAYGELWAHAEISYLRQTQATHGRDLHVYFPELEATLI